MKIFVRTDKRAEFQELEISDGMTLAEVANKCVENLKYRVLAAIVKNKVRILTEKVKNGDKITFIDMRTQAANMIYQSSLIMLYIRAVKRVLGEAVEVEIRNAINKGIYTVIKASGDVVESDIRNIENDMKLMVEKKLPFVINQDATVTLDGYTAHIATQIVPDTSYVEYFEVMKYRRGVLVRFPHSNNPNYIPEYMDEIKLYEAFGEATRWGKLMDICYAQDLNEKVKNGKYKELIQISEALHEKKIAELAERINSEKKRIILIAGPSSSGKTTFANRLLIQMKVIGLNPVYLGTDDYFVERSQTPVDEFGEPNFEDLSAIDIPLFNSNMNDLLSGKRVDLPTFDFIKGTKKFGKRVMQIAKDQPIVIEGIHALNEELTSLISSENKFKIYISPLTQLNIDSINRIPTTDARMLRRMVRDYNFRGHSAQRTLSSWQKVRAGEDKNIFPFSNSADAFFNSVHLYEIAVLKKYAKPLLEKIREDEEEFAEAVRLLKFLSYFETIEDDSIIANNSIIREFIGGSILV
ncbi:MAG: nucleoside kinase [Eubacteriales bacterium]